MDLIPFLCTFSKLLLQSIVFAFVLPLLEGVCEGEWLFRVYFLAGIEASIEVKFALIKEHYFVKKL